MISARNVKRTLTPRNYSRVLIIFDLFIENGINNAVATRIELIVASRVDRVRYPVRRSSRTDRDFGMNSRVYLRT